MSRVTRIVRRIGWPLLFAVVLVVVISLAAYPVRMYVDKKQQVAATETRVSQLDAENDTAQAHVDALHTDAEIERIAREDYGLVKEGEEAYHVLPPPQDPVEIPDVWPFEKLGKGP